MQKSWLLVGVFMGWDTGFKCVSTEKWCFSYITLHPLGVIHNTTGFILLKPRPIRRTFSGWKRTCRSWEVTYWVWPTFQLAGSAKLPSFVIQQGASSKPILESFVHSNQIIIYHDRLTLLSKFSNIAFKGSIASSTFHFQKLLQSDYPTITAPRLQILQM